MSQRVRQLLEMERAEAVPGAASVGRVVATEANGDVLVDFRGNELGPIRARVATSETLEAKDEPVLLLFENGDRGLPIVVGVLREGARRREPKRQLVFEAADEITIACGKSSITLRRDGRVVIKGTELVSRASGTNKVRGAVVQIN
jgi:hypothetical protein